MCIDFTYGYIYVYLVCCKLQIKVKEIRKK